MDQRKLIGGIIETTQNNEDGGIKPLVEVDGAAAVWISSLAEKNLIRMTCASDLSQSKSIPPSLQHHLNVFEDIFSIVILSLMCRKLDGKIFIFALLP